MLPRVLHGFLGRAGVENAVAEDFEQAAERLAIDRKAVEQEETGVPSLPIIARLRPGLTGALHQRFEIEQIGDLSSDGGGAQQPRSITGLPDRDLPRERYR